MSVIYRNLGLVSNDDVEVFAVRGRYDGMRTMLTGRITEGLNLNELVKVVVTIRIKKTINATPHGATARTDHHGAPAATPPLLLASTSGSLSRIDRCL